MRDYWSTLITVASLVILLVLISASYTTYKQSTNQLAVLQDEVKLLKNRNDTLNYNKTLTADQIETYNKILSTLIPESEDYFSIIYALETISKKTNFQIVAYTIGLSASAPDKIAITVEGKGSTQEFKQFLDGYEFTGGRLVTSEQIEFSGTTTNTKVALNFYNKKYAFGETVVPQLSKADIAQLDEIKNKIQVSFADSSTTNNTSYETKENPF